MSLPQVATTVPVPAAGPTILATVGTGSRSGWVLTPARLSYTRDGGSTWSGAAVPRFVDEGTNSGQLFVDGTVAWLAGISLDDGSVTVTRVDAAATLVAASTATLPGRPPGTSVVSVGFSGPLDGGRTWGVAPGAGGGGVQYHRPATDPGRL
jgi:hypothetical protein